MVSNSTWSFRFRPPRQVKRRDKGGRVPGAAGSACKREMQKKIFPSLWYLLGTGLLTKVFLLSVGGCSPYIQEARVDITALPQKELPPQGCGQAGARTPQVTKLGPYSEYGQSTVSVDDACRIAEAKVTRVADLYMSEYQSAGWVCKKTVDVGSREQREAVGQCLFTAEITCEYTLICR